MILAGQEKTRVDCHGQVRFCSWVSESGSLVVQWVLSSQKQFKNLRLSGSNLISRAFPSMTFKMAARREKTLATAGSRGTKSPKILEISIT